MLNIIKADMYRILRGKGFYITMILLLATIALQTAVSSKASVMTYNTEGLEIDTIEEFAEEVLLAPEAFTGSTAPFEMMDNTDTLLYFLLPFIIFIAAADFSTDTVKNVLSNGMSRIKYYLSKLILACVFCLLLLFINIIIPVVTATILRGFGGAFDIDFILRLLRPFAAQLFMCLAVTCVGIFLVFVTKRTAAVNGAYIAFCIIPMLIIYIFFMLNEELEFLFKYEVISNIRMLRHIDIAESTDIIRAFAVGAFYILASTIGGIAVFKRSEVK